MAFTFFSSLIITENILTGAQCSCAEKPITLPEYLPCVPWGPKDRNCCQFPTMRPFCDENHLSQECPSPFILCVWIVLFNNKVPGKKQPEAILQDAKSHSTPEGTSKALFFQKSKTPPIPRGQIKSPPATLSLHSYLINTLDLVSFWNSESSRGTRLSGQEI